MGKSASEVRQDIDMARRDMAYTMDEIADRASPRRVIGRGRRRTADRWHSMRVAIVGEPDDSGGAVGSVRAAARGAQGTAQSTAQGAAERAGEGASQLAGQAREAPEMVRQRTQGNPIAAGVIAFGAGLLGASIFPATRQEQRAAQKLRERAGPVQEELQKAGREMAGDLKGSAQEKADQVRQTSTEAAQKVGESARSSAETVQEQAKGSGGGSR